MNNIKIQRKVSAEKITVNLTIEIFFKEGAAREIEAQQRTRIHTGNITAKIKIYQNSK